MSNHPLPASLFRRALNFARNRARRLVRLTGWDVVRYHPMWSTPLGIEQLPVRTVLDIGAYTGDTARIFRRLYPRARLCCFEPQAGPLQILSTWAATQHGCVQVMPFGLGNRNGDVEMTCFPDLEVCSSLIRVDPARLARVPRLQRSVPARVPIRRLDDVAATLVLEDALLVKIDVEGYESEVIAGGAGVMRRAAACIIEVNLRQRYAEQPALREMLDGMASLGLDFAGVLSQPREPGPGVSYLDALFINWRLAGPAARPASVIG